MSPTNINQYNLPAGSGSMSRSNSIPAQDSFDLYGEGHPLGGSANSLEERPRAISRSGSFRDSTDEGGENKLTINHKWSIFDVYLVLISFLRVFSPRLFTVASLQHIFIVLGGNYDDFFFFTSTVGFMQRFHMAELWTSVGFRVLIFSCAGN